jgi:hypothetical protein
MPTPDDGSGHDDTRVGIGRSQDERGTETVYGPDYSYDAPVSAANTEDAYADYISRPLATSGMSGEELETHRLQNYPTTSPPQLSPSTRDDLLAANRIDPGAVQKKMFIDVAKFVDPATGKPLPSSPIEQLRRDLDRLRGLGDKPSMEVLISRATLTDNDLGTWQAAADMKATTDQAQSGLRSAVTQLCSVYESIIETLDQTVQSALAADQAAADGLRKAAT